MEDIHGKAHFLKHDYTKTLSQLDVNAQRKWGKMNVLQMIEHMTEYVQIASGRKPMPVVTPEDKIARMQAFLQSEKPFQENTPNVLMPDTPTDAKHATKDAAIAELQQEIDHFFEVYGYDPAKKIANPFFGELDKDMQVQLLHKHAIHHLRQFGVMA